LFGDSDDMGFGPKDYKLINSELLFGTEELRLSKREKEFLEAHASTLLEMSEVDIKDCRAPESANVPPHEDEKGRWEVRVSDSHRVGTVVRVGDGSRKHYLLYLWDGGWYRVQGQPCFDLPMFGLPGLREDDHKPVMIHEGPKAWRGAARLGDEKFSGSVGRLSNWMKLYSHVAWHGSDVGMEWTDWSPLRGRRVLVWPDVDEAGLLNARALARRISMMGGIVEYVNWSVGDIAELEGWDWADPVQGFIAELTRTEIRLRLMAVESPIDAAGNVLEEWAKRSFYDAERGEVYVRSRGYRPLPLTNYVAGLPKGTRERIVGSSINEFVGTDYRPGVEYGRLRDGKINLARSSIREPIATAPLARTVYEELIGGWLSQMIPDVRQRKHLIRRAAWALARPHKVPNHMIVLQGDSGIGKSVFLDTLIRVAGADRAAALFPDSIMGKFNNQIAYKSIVGIHEIHSDDITRRQNAARLKELIANEMVITEEKNRPKVSHTNVIHWFAATNERVPFSLSHGNDRFYFVKCATPQTPRDIRRKDRFFEKWVPKFHDEAFLDQLYAAAKWTCDIMNSDTARSMTTRAKKQKVWQILERSSYRPWEQFVLGRLNELEDLAKDKEIPLVFFGNDLVRLTTDRFRTIGENDVRNRMVEFGYRTLRDQAGAPVKRRVASGKREPLWVKADMLSHLQARGGHGSLEVVSLGSGSDQAE
jgi:hypothetical protein